ncbi:MAG: 50S ribosomal protein L10 [Deltaproteobacteria bacterium]|jgi:large subunit ribosomal protein L10|nr:50S ribosomal protein L10 [Deltaproteobacteria bacterium]
MNRVEKTKAIEELREIAAKAQSFVLVDFSGVTVEQINKVRRDFEANDCEYKVVKNTLFSKALADTDAQVITELLKGPVAIAWSFEEPAPPAKIAVKYQKEIKKFDIIGGYMEGELLDKEGVSHLSKMPSKPELQSKLLATMLAVPQNMMRLMEAAPKKFLMLLQAKQEADKE